MCRIGKIKNSNVAGVNLSGIGIFVNQSIKNKKDDAQTTTSAKVYAIGIVRGWTMFWVIVSVLLSIAAIIFCIAALYRNIKDDNLGYDYLGVIVGILALFITFVVAWQIWATIATKEDIKKVTEAADKLDTLEVELNKQRTLFENRNLEIKHLIDAHARLHEAENTEDLGSKYILYIEAIEKLIQSKMDISYEQFENARYGLMSTVNAFSELKDINEIEDFINREREYEWHYKQLMSQLKIHSDDMNRLRRQLSDLRDFRATAIAVMKKSDIGKHIERIAAEREKEMRELEKSLREKYAKPEATSDKSTEAKGNPS